MKVTIHLLFTCLLVMYGVSVYPAIGCLDTSKHVKVWGDFKNLHPVSCNCLCGSDQFHLIITTKRNRCMHCRHYRLPSFYNPFINWYAQSIHQKRDRISHRPFAVHRKGKALYSLFENM